MLYVKFFMKISALVIVKNEEKKINACLLSLSFVDELVIILDGCNDDSKKITLFDKDQDKYVDYTLLSGYPIPVFGSSVIQKLIPFIERYGYIKAVKTNEPSRNLEFDLERTEKYKYPCILSATFQIISS